MDETLRFIKERDLAIEISTAGWRKPVGEQYPAVEVIRLAQEIGIPFTVASDAHSHVQLAENYERLAALIEDAASARFASSSSTGAAVPLPL